MSADAARLPFEPLAQLLARYEVNREPCGFTPRRVAGLLGVEDRQVYRWRLYGLSERQADRLCTRIGRHPSELWPEWWAGTFDETSDAA